MHDFIEGSSKYGAGEGIKTYQTPCYSLKFLFLNSKIILPLKLVHFRSAEST